MGSVIHADAIYRRFSKEIIEAVWDLGSRFLKLEMHPDGAPWAKCCGCKGGDPDDGCAYRVVSQMVLKVVSGLPISVAERRTTSRMMHYAETSKSVPFPCCHREDNGYFRVCAGWHARNKNNVENS